MPGGIAGVDVGDGRGVAGRRVAVGVAVDVSPGVGVFVADRILLIDGVSVVADVIVAAGVADADTVGVRAAVSASAELHPLSANDPRKRAIVMRIKCVCVFIGFLFVEILRFQCAACARAAHWIGL